MSSRYVYLVERYASSGWSQTGPHTLRGSELLIGLVLWIEQAWPFLVGPIVNVGGVFQQFILLVHGPTLLGRNRLTQTPREGSWQIVGDSELSTSRSLGEALAEPAD